VLRHPEFVAGDFDTSFVERVLAAEHGHDRPIDVALAAAAIHAFLERQAARRAPAGANPSSAWWRAGLREAQEGRL
jgi:hypothetical protein